MGEHNMADAADGLQPAVADPNFKFPQLIEVTLTFKVEVLDQAERDYWLDPNTGAATLDIVADFTDVINDNFSAELVSVNGLTYAQIQQAIAEHEV
jgi:hypothetical protein